MLDPQKNLRNNVRVFGLAPYNHTSTPTSMTRFTQLYARIVYNSLLQYAYTIYYFSTSMQFIKNLHFEQMPTRKKMLLSGLLLLIAAVALSILKMVFLGTMGMNNMGYNAYRGYNTSYGVAESAPSFAPNFESDAKSMFLSQQFPIPFPPPYIYGDITPGSDAEAYEITSYNASIKVRRNSEQLCASILALKTRTDVIFETSNQSETGCSYTFKVQNNKAGEILSIIKNLDPQTLNANTHTIKRTITGLMNETEILTKKLASIESTLEQALSAYDEISRIAAADKDAESLAKIIDSKIAIIERLTAERVNVQNQIREIERTYSDQLDHLNYTVFNISVYEQKVLDFEDITDSWVIRLRAFAEELNGTIQQMTVGILSLLIQLAYYAVILVILLYVAKNGWRMTKKFWKS